VDAILLSYENPVQQQVFREHTDEQTWKWELRMSLVIEAPPVPLRTDDHGVLRVGNTRAPLDTVVYAFNQGASPEEIMMSYPILDLAHVYAVVNYYLYNRAEVDAYLRQREAAAARIQDENEKRFPQEGIRARLLGRRKTKV
jgi:uncharacterized protein (DUF433 family)